MKKMFSLIVAVLLLSTMAVSVSAYTNTYYLEEPELRLDIPSDYVVITEDTPADDPIFVELGMTKDSVMEQFKTSHIYLNAGRDNFREEIVVTMVENELDDFALYSDDVLDAAASAMAVEYVDYGYRFIKYDFYNHHQAKFIRVYFSDTDETVFGLQYYTVYGGKAMNVTLRSYQGAISSEQEATMKAIADSIVFEKDPPVAEQETPQPVQSEESSASFKYTDSDSGVTFTVPANWKQEVFHEEREYLKAKFVSLKAEGHTMLYGCADLWEQLPEISKIGYTRSDVDSSFFTKEDIADMYGMEPDSVTTVTYNGSSYFMGEIRQATEVNGVDLAVTMTQLVRIENGWMHQFSFSGTSTHVLFADFEALLESVDYPTSFSAGADIDSNDSSEIAKENREKAVNRGAFSVIVAIVAGAVATAIWKKKTPQPSVALTAENTAASETEPPSSEQARCCGHCGHELLPNSEFCRKCGTAVNKE